VFAASSAVAGGYAARGLGRFEMNVLRVAADGARRAAPSRASWRERWGLDDEVFLVAMVAEPSSAVDALVAARTATRLAAVGRRARVLVHHGAASRVAAARWLRATGYDALLFDDAVAEPWRLWSAVDAAIVVTGRDPRDLRRPEPGVLPLLGAMGAGVPVVAEETDTVRDVIGAGETALLAPPRDVNGLAAAVTRLCDDRAAARAMGARGAARVREAFAFAGYRAGLMRAYGLS